MSKSNIFENDLLKLIFNGTPIANIADNSSVSPLTNLYLSLHTADPGEAGDQTTNEISYVGYNRVAVPRNSLGWTVTNNIVRPTDSIDFGVMTDGTPNTVTHVGFGTAVSGVGKLLYIGTISPNISVAVGVAPRVSSSSTITED